MTTAVEVDGAILAGGQSSRMQSDKRAIPWLGATLLESVIDRLAPQVRRVLVSSTSPTNIAGRDCLHVPDSQSGHGGPLVGIQSCLEETARAGEVDWLAIVPCDAPFAPKNLVERLLAQVERTQYRIGVVHYGGHLQPTFSIWHCGLLPALKAAVTQRPGGIMAFLDKNPHAVVHWPEQSPPPFFNINTPADLEWANHICGAR